MQVFPDPGVLMSDKIRKDYGLGGIGISVAVSLITSASHVDWSLSYS